MAGMYQEHKAINCNVQTAKLQETCNFISHMVHLKMCNELPGETCHALGKNYSCKVKMFPLNP